MAKYFLYPDPGIYDTGAITTGTSNGTAFSSSSSIVNADRITDQSIGSAITDFDENDAIRINMGASSSPNAIAFYHSAADDNDINIYASDDATLGTAVENITANFSAGWTIVDITVSSKQYLYIVNVTAAEWDYCTEIVVGTKYTFDRNYDLGGKFGKSFGVTNMQSYGGVEYSHKKHDGKETWAWEWTRLTNAHMNNLITLRDAVEGSRFKFLYYDGSDWNWVRMSDKSLQKKEIAYQTYNTSIQLTQQLS